jgi:cytochrome b6-f complex iron-sulfur subunit
VLDVLHGTTLGAAQTWRLTFLSPMLSRRAFGAVVSLNPCSGRPVSQQRHDIPSSGGPAAPTRSGVRAVESRRGFLAAMLGSALGVGLATLGAVAGLWTAAGARFLFPNTSNGPADRFRAGFPRDYPPGHVETRYRETYGVWVVRAEYDGRQQIVALSTACTHLGCPCHGSGFAPDGVNREGPAPRPLERYAIRLTDDGQLEVDKSRTFRKELGQWDDTDSYVLI